MKYKETGRQRLLDLATHLEQPKHGLDQFDFSSFYYKWHCCTAGCAIGECPTVFPDWWEIVEAESAGPIGYPQSDFLVRLRKEQTGGIELGTMASVQYFFRLDPQEARHLFCPECQIPRLFGGEVLTDFATADQVASNIRAFLAR